MFTLGSRKYQRKQIALTFAFAQCKFSLRGPSYGAMTKIMSGWFVLKMLEEVRFKHFENLPSHKVEPASVLVNRSGHVSQLAVFGADVKVPVEQGIH